MQHIRRRFKECIDTITSNVPKNPQAELAQAKRICKNFILKKQGLDKAKEVFQKYLANK